MAFLIIPNPNDQLSVSQGQIQNNFTSLDATFSVNHGGFVAENGKHTFVEMTLQATPPTTVGNEVGLYCGTSKAGDVTPQVPALFFKTQNSPSSSTGIDFTTSVNASPGWTRLPSGIIFQWGMAEAFMTTGFPLKFPTACFGIELTATSNIGMTAEFWSYGNVTATNFTTQSYLYNGDMGTGTTAFYFAVGV